MRILIGIDTHGLIGGSERYALQIAEELRLRNHAVGVLCGKVEPQASAPKDLWVLPAYSAERSSPAQLDELETTIRTFRPDVLYLLSARGRAAVRRMTRLARELPVIRFIQDHTLFCPGLNKLHADGRNCTEPFGLACLRHYFLEAGCSAFRRDLHRSSLDALGGVWKWKRGLDVARRATCLAVASRYMRQELLTAGIPAEKIELIPYFTRSGSAAAVAREPDSKTAGFVRTTSAPLVLVPARLTVPEKGVDVLLEALSRVHPPFRALIAGSGPAEDELRALARARGLLDRVHFAGWQDAQALEWLYARADIVAFPSTWNEPFGLVGIEAMSHAKPVVAFDVGGVSDWLTHESTGLLCPPRDIEALARSLERLLESPPLRVEYGRRAKAEAEKRFSAERHLAALEGLFQRLAQRKNLPAARPPPWP